MGGFGLEDAFVTGHVGQLGGDTCIGVFLFDWDPDVFGVATDHVVDRSPLSHWLACRAEVELVADVSTFNHLAVKDVADTQAADGDLARGDASAVNLVGVGRLHLFTLVEGEVETDTAITGVVGCSSHVTGREHVVVGRLGVAWAKEARRARLPEVYRDVVESAVAHSTQVDSEGPLFQDQDVQSRDGQGDRLWRAGNLQTSRPGGSGVVQFRQ